MPKRNIALHRKYGPLVRIGPDMISVYDPAALSTIYGFKPIYLKTAFYPIVEALYDDKLFANIFTTRSEKYHAHLKRASVTAYSMTSLADLEPHVQPVIGLFLKRIDEIGDGGKKVFDIGIWLQYFTFDALGETNFSEQLGFLETGTDFGKSIGTIDGLLPTSPSLAKRRGCTNLRSKKKEPYISLNPNGCVPAIVDPNIGITLAESGAIIQYLIETYDKDAKLHYTTTPEKFAEYQWLHFQMSGQGPYFGQKAWFTQYHPKKVPSAELRYVNETRRVLGVIDAHLTKQKTEYLIGNKVSYADLAWITWNSLLGWLVPDLDAKKEFPKFAEWNDKLVARPAVAKILVDKEKAGH